MFVLPHLSLEKEVGHPALFLDAPGGQAIDIFAFAAGLLEILYLDKTLLDQGIDKEVDLAEADPQPGGEFTLGHLGRSVDLPEDAKRLLIFESIRRTRQLNGHPFAPSRSFCEHRENLSNCP